MKVLTIEWLDDCPICGCSTVNAHTENGNDGYLYSGDDVECSNCGHEGIVACDDEGAYVEWGPAI